MASGSAAPAPPAASVTGAVVCLYSPKGGVGKTTTVIVVGSELARRGYRVAIVDCDPNGHALRCGTRFKLDRLHVAGVETEQTILPTLSRLRKEHDVVLVDLPGSASRLTLMAMSRAQLVLIPVQPSEPDAVDTSKADADVDIAAETADRTVERRFLLSRVPAHTELRIARWVRGELEKKGMVGLKTQLIERLAWKEALLLGRSPSDDDPGSNAALNARALADEVIMLLGGNPG